MMSVLFVLSLLWLPYLLSVGAWFLWVRARSKVLSAVGGLCFWLLMLWLAGYVFQVFHYTLRWWGW